MNVNLSLRQAALKFYLVMTSVSLSEIVIWLEISCLGLRPLGK